MKIEIDQSGKIENTSRLTILAYSNKTSKSILITAKDKKTIQSLFRRINQPKIFIYKLFSVAVFALIKNDLEKIDQVIIDREYVGYENLIKKLISETVERNNKKIEKENIHFHSIGKKSKAHKIALAAFKTKRADMRLTSKEFFKIGLVK